MAACVPRPSQVALQKTVVEKVGLKFLHAVYIAKSSETIFSQLAAGFEDFRWRAKMKPTPRAPGPPRLAAGGRGTVMPKRLGIFAFLAFRRYFLAPIFFDPDQQIPRVPH